MNTSTRNRLHILLALCLLLPLGLASAATPHDKRALDEVTVGKGLFDVNHGNPKVILVILGVIEETLDGLKEHGVKPDLVVAFRGPSARFLTTDMAKIDADQLDASEKIAQRIKELADRGVHFEACAISTRMMGIDNDTIIPSVTVVANTFNSLIGYQARGYAIIPIM